MSITIGAVLFTSWLERSKYPPQPPYADDVYRMVPPEPLKVTG
jgi:hypothetical protein